MLTRRRFLVLAGGTLPLAAGIGVGAWLLPSSGSSNGLPSIRWDEEPCTHCGMIISDHRFAAAWIEPHGVERHFDDVGCLVAGFHQHRPVTGTRVFVHDYASGRWLDATAAVYLSSPKLHTPMAYEVAAFESAAAGRAALGEAPHHAWHWHELLSELEMRH